MTILVRNMLGYQVALIAEVRRSDEVKDAVDPTLDQWGRVDVHVNNTAMTCVGS